MATLKIMASEAGKNAAAFIEAENRKKAELFEKRVQKSLDDVSEYIIEASSNGRFKVEIRYEFGEEVPERVDPNFDGIFIYDEDVLEEVFRILQEGGYEANKEKYNPTTTIKILWDDPEDEDGCK